MIALLRHGQTQANARRLFAGSLDLPLSPEGREELLGLRAPGAYPEAALFFTSGLLRCEQSLELLYGPVPHTRLPALAEYHFGRFEGLSHLELDGDPAYQAWLDDPLGATPCPGGESRVQFLHRVREGFAPLAPWLASPQVAVAVLHGGVIASLMEELFPDTHPFLTWQPLPGHGWLCSAEAFSPLPAGKL